MTEYYKDFNKYVSRKRWMSYWHQVKEVLDTQPKSVLLIGIGNGIIPAILKEKGIQVYTFDNDESLSPDFVVIYVTLKPYYLAGDLIQYFVVKFWST